MSVNDIYRVTIAQRLHGQQTINVLHYRVTAVGSGTQGIDLAAAVLLNIVQPGLLMQAQELTHESISAQLIFPGPPLVPIVSTAGAAGGTGPADSLPTAVALVFTKRTIYAGPKYRGRAFIAGIPKLDEDNSAISAAATAQWTALAALYALPLTGGTNFVFSPIIWHRATNTYDTVVTCVMRPTLRTQRRRQLGKGV